MDDPLLTEKRRRRNALQLQAARYGIDTPPHVTIEIEDLTREIAMLEQAPAPVTVGSGGNKTAPPATPITANQAETILAIFAEPRTFTATDWTQEARELRSLLTPFNQRYRLQELAKCTAEELYRALLFHRPQMLHFQGHGTEQGIVLEDTSGDGHRVTWKALMRTLESCKSLTCVVLNACDTYVHAQVGRQRFHLITTPGSVSTEATHAFTEGFYNALIAGESVPGAYEQSCGLLGLKGIAENEWPVLSEART